MNAPANDNFGTGIAFIVFGMLCITINDTISSSSGCSETRILRPLASSNSPTATRCTKWCFCAR